jgi:hypothetical protein
MLVSAATAVAQPGQNRDRDRDGIPNRYDSQPNRPNGRGDRDRDGVPNRFDRTPNRPDWHFDQGRRDQFNRYYRNDAMRWRNNSRRPNFTPGYVIPRNYAIRAVPRAYWNGMAAPPPGYQYGYYDGYVVAYNPTTRIIADVMDLVAGLSNR